MTSWLEFGAIVFCFLVTQVIVRNEGRDALRACLEVHLRVTHQDEVFCVGAPRGTGWWASTELREIFGPRVYSALRDLHRRKVLERREGEVLAIRGGRPAIWYRYKP